MFFDCLLFVFVLLLSHTFKPSRHMSWMLMKVHLEFRLLRVAHMRAWKDVKYSSQCAAILQLSKTRLTLIWLLRFCSCYDFKSERINAAWKNSYIFIKSCRYRRKWFATQPLWSNTIDQRLLHNLIHRIECRLLIVLSLLENFIQVTPVQNNTLLPGVFNLDVSSPVKSMHQTVSKAFPE